MNRKQKGNALSQYAIIIGLVALAAVPAFLLFGNQIVSALTTYVDQYTNMNSIVASNVDNVANSTNNINTANTSVEDNSNSASCSDADNTCSIDFGDFKLSSVPQDLNKLIETSGVSGGMDNLTSLLDQIAQQYEEQGKTEEAKDIKILATTGHNMAVIEKELENFIINTCKGDTTCINSYANKEFPKPAGFDETYQAFPKGVTYEYTFSLINIGKTLNKEVNTNYPEFAISKFYNETLNKINNNSAISDKTKSIVQELTWDIGTLSQKWLIQYTRITDPAVQEYLYTYTYDPLTGKEIDVDIPADITYESIYNDLQNIKVPELTHVDSGLMCASGGYTDSGTACH